MNSVNLLPARRSRSLTTTAPGSVPFLGLIVVLLLVLLGMLFYVNAHNRETTRQAQLTQFSSGVARWTAVANSYDRYSSEAEQHTTELAAVRQLAAARFDWSNLLEQVAELLPRDAQLTSLQATTPVTTGSPATPATPATSGSTTGTGTPIQVSACATSQPAVAQTMVALRQISGVTGVTLASSSASTSGAGSGSAASTGAGTGSASGSSGGCSLPVQFQITLTFTAPTSTSAAAATSTP